ncbi:MAG TPA: pantetheine-phosphate adenylyltransferase [Bacteroidales bacterium]|jgi:pantetheine-phosphate adenylyltransferase|nr:pantetheine-phosphate adenylyltransferase [Bacteroidales bacterium]
MEKVAVFPGSFDPFTVGHESIVNRAQVLFDKIYIAVGFNSKKDALFSLDDRKKFIAEVFQGNPKIEIVHFEGLTIEFCKKVNANYILRGLRTAADFEYERAIAQVNKAMYAGIETVFFLTMPEHTPINSSIVRDIIRHGGDASKFLPAKMNIKKTN